VGFLVSIPEPDSLRAPMPTAVIELERVTKRYAGHVAVRALDLSVPPGSIYGLLGPNGAGKTSSIRVIMNIAIPDEGRVRLFGVEGGGRSVSHRVGYLPEERGLYRKMRIMDLLVFLAQTKGVARATARARAVEWLDRLGLGQWRQRKVDDLSKGMQQKVQFISTVLHGPELVILDEPFSGLDPVNTEVVKDTVMELVRGGATVLFSTHIMEQAEKLCDAVCIIARGEKVVDGPLSEIKRAHGGRNLVLAVEDGSAAVDRLLADQRLVARATRSGQFAEIELTPMADPQEVLRRMVESGVRITRFEITEPSLHKIFLDRVGPEAAVAPATGGSGGNA